MKHAFVVKLTPGYHRFASAAGEDPNAPRFVRQWVPRDGDDENPHAFTAMNLEVGFGRIEDAFKFETLDEAVRVVGERKISEEYVHFLGYKASVVLVRLRWEGGHVVEALGDVGQEVWPEGSVEEALKDLEGRTRPKGTPFLIYTLKEPGWGDTYLWWKPNAAGYTRYLEEAGRWSEEDARRHASSGTVFVVEEAVAASKSKRVVFLGELDGPAPARPYEENKDECRS